MEVEEIEDYEDDFDQTDGGPEETYGVQKQEQTTNKESTTQETSKLEPPTEPEQEAPVTNKPEPPAEAEHDTAHATPKPAEEQKTEVTTTPVSDPQPGEPDDSSKKEAKSFAKTAEKMTTGELNEPISSSPGKLAATAVVDAPISTLVGSSPPDAVLPPKPTDSSSSSNAPLADHPPNTEIVITPPQSPATSSSSSTGAAPRPRRPSTIVTSFDASAKSPPAGSFGSSPSFPNTPYSRSSRSMANKPAASFRRPSVVAVALGRWLPPQLESDLDRLRVDLQALDRDSSGTLSAAALRKAVRRLTLLVYVLWRHVYPCR
jgi:hypothetical protein